MRKARLAVALFVALMARPGVAERYRLGVNNSLKLVGFYTDSCNPTKVDQISGTADPLTGCQMKAQSMYPCNSYNAHLTTGSCSVPVGGYGGGTTSESYTICAIDLGAAKPAGTICRAAAGSCDAAETCNGSSNSCPADAFKASGAVCRAAVSVCDRTEVCSGTSAACPADLFAPAGGLCRAAAGVCDVAETCTGSSGSCPADAKRPSSYVCRAASGVCDVADTCDGRSSTCPADGFLPAGTACRSSRGICDAPVCTGASPDCPLAAVKPSSAVCRPSAAVCDQTEYCDGIGYNCPPDLPAAATRLCYDKRGNLVRAIPVPGGSGCTVACP